MKIRLSLLQPFCIVTAALALFLLSTRTAQAKSIGADPPNSCRICVSCSGACTNPPVQQSSDTGSNISRTEGNLSERLEIARISGTFGATVSFTVIYNSYNADYSRAQLDTVMGYGWTHSYNVFLFGQFGAMFRFDGEGRVTRYGLGAGGTYITAPGYFETLVKNINGTFTLTEKDKTAYTFASIPNTPFLVGGPVYRLTSIVDRNGNTTTLTYTAGNLTAVTDTYGRAITFTYNAQHKLASATDPAGRTTTFQYDSTGHKLTNLTDPNGKSLQYSYNILYQITAKVDKDGRAFSYSYANYEPVSVKDGGGASAATLSNPNNWATDSTQLAMYQTRVYLPSTTSVTDGRGNVWRYQYDSHGYLTNATAPDGAVTKYSYDPATLLLSSRTDADGNTTTYQYDSQGNMTSATDAIGHTSTYTYEPVFNMVTSVTDPRGRVTTYTYDGDGNRLQETDPLGDTRQWTYDSHGNVVSATDFNGNTTTYQYDSFGNQITITDPLGNATTTTYDAAGNVLSRTDPNGHATTYQYDGLNRVTRETDALNNTTQTVYDGQGNRAQTTDRDGHVTTYQYDLRQRLIKTTDAVGDPETYTYDGNDNRLSTTDRDGHTTTNQYDSQNRQTKVTDALGNTSTTTYDSVGNVVSQTDANGHATTYSYDALNRRVTLTDALGNSVQYGYDTGALSGCPSCGATPGSSLVTRQTDPNGEVIYFKYDALDRLIDVVRKVGSTVDVITANDAVTSYSYDADGNRLTMTEPNGNATTYQYDADNRRIQETNAAGDVAKTAYDGVGNVVSTTAPNGNLTTTTYDAVNRVTQVSDSVGLVTKYTYDAVGNRLTQADGNLNTTTYSYDALNRAVSITDPLGKTTTTQYDAVGNVLTITDRNGNATTYAYDAINRRTTTTDALTHATTYQYDAVGNLIKLTDANGHATSYSYDAIDRPSAETYPDGGVRRYSYDGVGNVIGRTDQIGQATSYTYNDLYFLVGRTYPSAINDSFTYDLSGRVLTAQRGSWAVTYTYDGANRVTQTTQNGKTINYSYDIPGRTRQVTYPGGRSITEHTDARTRLDHIDDGSSPPSIVQYTYDPGDRVTSRAYRNGTSTAYNYNGNNWTLSVEHSLGAARIAGFGYAYDNEGNKAYEQKLHDAANSDTNSQAYQYDAVNRLIAYQVGTLVGSTVPSPSTQTAYTLDPVGNWNSKTTDAVTQNRQHNTVNELIQIDAVNLSYDADGNLLSDGVYMYAYDEENRLAQVTRMSDSAVVGQYQYDALNRRVSKIANPAGSPSTTFYYYDDRRIIEEQDGGGITQATYVYGAGVDEILTADRGAQTYYYHQNALGSVAAVTDSTGGAVERYSYDGYGQPSITDGFGISVSPNAWGTPHSAIGNPWMFTGRQFDEEDGLYFYRARYHDSAKGRFLQRDSLEYQDGLNLYQYVRSNPTRFTDPEGTETLEVNYHLDGTEKTNYAATYVSYDRADTGNALAIFDLDVTNDKVAVSKIRNGSNNTQATVVIDRWTIGKMSILGLQTVLLFNHTTGVISHAANGSSRAVCCNAKPKRDGVEITADFVSTAGTLTVKDGGNVGVKGSVKGAAKGMEAEGGLEGGISWEVTTTNTGFTVQPSAKYRLCPDGSGGYSVKLLSTSGVGIAATENTRHYFHRRDGVDWFSSILSHTKKN